MESEETLKPELLGILEFELIVVFGLILVDVEPLDTLVSITDRLDTTE